jgi:ABC-2 type transport system permease protein
MIEETFRGAWVVSYRELLRFLQERTRLVSSFAMPLLFLVMFGAGFTRVIGDLAPGVNFIQFMYPGILAMSVLTTSLMAGVSVVWDREFGFLREIMVAPISRTGIVLGKAIGAAAIALLQVLTMLLIAPIIGVGVTPMLVLKLIPLVLVLSISLSGLGLLLASRMRSQQGFQMLMQVILFPMIFLAGVFFPVNNVPAWLEVIAKLNPLTYGVDAFRQVFLQEALGAPAGTAELGVTVFGHTMGIMQEVALMMVLGAILISAAVWSFNRPD